MNNLKLSICLIASLLLIGCSSPTPTETTKISHAFCQKEYPQYEDNRQYIEYDDQFLNQKKCSDFYIYPNQTTIRYGTSADNNQNLATTIDIATFQIFNKTYARDYYNIYLNSEPIQHADPETFELLSSTNKKWNCTHGCYGKDKDNIFYNENQILEADHQSFSQLQNFASNYARDKNHIYFRGKQIESANPETFAEIEYGYFKDQNSLFFKKSHSFAAPQKIPNSHSSSFELLTSKYAKDQNQVYYVGQIVTDADPETFVVEDGEYFAKDKNHLYVGAEKRDKKSAIKNYIEAYLAQSSPNTCYPYNLAVNNTDTELILKINFGNEEYNFDNIAPPLITCCYEHQAISCVTRADERVFQDLEKQLKEQFSNVKKLTTYYGKQLAYQDQKYHYETTIRGLSPDGRYANLEFSYSYGPGPNYYDCPTFDMQTGKCLAEIDYDREEWYQDRESIENEFDQKFAKLNQQYQVTNNFDKSAGFLASQKTIDDETTLNFEAIDSRDEWIKDADPIEKEMFQWAKLYYYHKPSGIKHTVKIIENNPFQFYGHANMKGLILLTYSWWEGETIISPTIISQDHLDKKLAEFNNNVAMHYYNQGNFQTAIKYFDQAIATDNTYAQAHFNKAATHSLLLENDSALNALNKAIKLDPTKFKSKAKIDPDFKSLQEHSQFKELVK